MQVTPLLYLETSVFGFAFDRHPGNAFRRRSVRTLFDQIARGQFRAVTSPLTIREFNQAATDLRDQLVGLLTDVRLLDIADSDIEQLAGLYVKEGVIPEDYDDDARHAAYATLSESEVLVTLNLKHLANEWAARRLNAINMREGLRLLSIRTPEEVVKYEE